MLALHAGSRRFDSHRGHMSEHFFRSSGPGYPHPVSSELENSGIRVAVGDCSVTEHRRWRPPYQTGKTVHLHVKNYKHNEDGRTAPGVCGNGSVPLSHSGNVVTRIRIQTHTLQTQWSLTNGLSARSRRKGRRLDYHKVTHFRSVSSVKYTRKSASVINYMMLTDGRLLLCPTCTQLNTQFRTRECGLSEQAQLDNISI